MVNSPDCCTSLFSSQLTPALTICVDCESSLMMSLMQYNNYVTLHCIWAHMRCIGADSDDSTDSIISVYPGKRDKNYQNHSTEYCKSPQITADHCKSPQISGKYSGGSTKKVGQV